MPKESYGIAGLVAAIISIYCVATYSGPYKFVADQMVALFNVNIVILPLVVTALVAGGPLALLIYFLEKRWGRKATWFTPIWEEVDRMLDQPAGKVFLAGMVGISLGGYFTYLDTQRGPLIPVSVRDLERGEVPKGTYVELIDGEFLHDNEFTIKGRTNFHRFVPVVSDLANTKIVLFLSLGSKQADRDAAGRVIGILEQNALPGELQTRLQENGYLAPIHFILGVGRVPDPSVGGWIALAGLLMSVVGILWWLKIR